jgi:hypothetical protein
MLVSRSGPNINDAAGDVVDIPKKEAERMMAASPPQCEVFRTKKAQRAVKPTTGEKAVK